MNFNNPNLYEIPRRHGSGKTTVLRELAKLAFPMRPRVDRTIIQEQVQAGGTVLPWHDREAYTRLMLERSIQSYLEHVPPAEPVFSGREKPDTNVRL
jgi:predicted ATPase